MALDKVCAHSFFAATIPIDTERCVFQTPLVPKKTILSWFSKNHNVSKSKICFCTFLLYHL